MMKRSIRHLLLVAAVWMGMSLAPSGAQAQEFNCRATVNYTQLSGSGFTFLDELAEQVENYFNLRQWTEDRFLDYERIDCNLRVIIQESISLTRFRAQLIAEIRRPIYGTTQSTLVVRLNDQNWTFNYAQGDPLDFDLERFDPLTSVLDFYALVMLGYDYDSFSELGGTPHFRRARRIAELAQAQGAAGWSQVGTDRNRTELINQLLDPRFQPIRKAYFDYHFGGLDRFVLETDEARYAVLDALGQVRTVYEALSRQYLIDLFFDTKYQELNAIFEGSNLRADAYELLSQVDPAHLTQYNALIE